MATEVVKIVDPDGGTGYDYLSLSLWEAGEQGNLVTADQIAVAKCRCTGGTADTTQCVINGWTTDATRYIKIWADPSESYRHAGMWSGSKYRMVFTATGDGFIGLDCYGLEIYVDGLQFAINANGYNDVKAVRSYTWAGQRIVYFLNCLFKKTDAGTTAVIGYYATSDGAHKIRNCIAYDFGAGTWARAFNLANGTLYAYNCTTHNCSKGFLQESSTFIVKNCIAQDCTDGFTGTFDGSSNYNCSDISGDAPGADSQTGEVTFKDEAADDFHLDSTDTVAKGKGLNLYNDANYPFQDDIDGNDRGGSGATWDIGADEYVAAGGGLSISLSENLVF